MTHNDEDVAVVAARKPARLTRIGIWAFDHRKRVLAMWLIGLVVLAGAGRVAGPAFSDKTNGGKVESQRAQNLLATRFAKQAGDSARIVFHTTGSSPVEQYSSAIAATIAAVAQLPHVDAVASPFSLRGQVSADRRTAYSVVQFDTITDDLTAATVQNVIDRARQTASAGLDVELGGAPVAKAERPGFGSSELIGIVAALVILLIAFGSLVAAGLPILIALLGLAPAFGIIAMLSHPLVVPSFAPELAALVGLGVGIDYALFVVTRYRSGLHDGKTNRDALVDAQASAGRAVLFAGGTVITSLFGLFLLGVPYANGLALGTIATVVLMVAGALTLLPAMLGFAGSKIERIRATSRTSTRVRASKRSMWWRWSRTVQRRPAPYALGALAVLVTLAIPMLSLHLNYTDQGNGTTDLTSRRAYDLITQGFGPGANGPLVLAVGFAPVGGAQVLSDLSATLRRVPDVASVTRPVVNATGDAAVLTVVPRTSPQDRATERLVTDIRTNVARPLSRTTGAAILVGGTTAAGIDSSRQFARRLPIVISLVVLLSIILLMIVFRSIAVPLKAAIMNLLSVGAAYGIIVAVFQWGWLGSVFGIGKTGPIDPWVPLMLFTILFGLSMDYEVFLLSRVREHWLTTHDNAAAVADGLADTARVITAAALIMVCVFGSFVLGDLRVLKLFGLGMAAAVLIDATLIRVVLVPATMELLGNANLWIPKWLDRFLPTVTIEDEAFDTPTLRAEEYA